MLFSEKCFAALALSYLIFSVQAINYFCPPNGGACEKGKQEEESGYYASSWFNYLNVASQIIAGNPTIGAFAAAASMAWHHGKAGGPSTNTHRQGHDDDDGSGRKRK